MRKPELVLPAGSLEKLITAINFGADAIYLGGKDFSLRAFAGNFSLEEMSAGLQYAHQKGKRAYITVNILAHNQDILKLPSYLEAIAGMEVDGLIISDPGVIRLAQKYSPNIPLTVSTQANVTNYESAAFYKDMGVQRIVLARELTLREIAEIKQRVEIELEVFVHGAMCVSYSGRCLLSHYMTGRSANRGECAHPCRYQYQLLEEKRPGVYYSIEEDDRGSYILNSSDLCLIEYIPELAAAGIDAFKVEGRMKSPLYVATVSRIYRQAVDAYIKDGNNYNQSQLEDWLKELQGVATRPFTNGFIEGETDSIQDINKREMSDRAHFCGMVLAYNIERQMVELEQRANFGPGEQLEFMVPDGRILKLKDLELFDYQDNLLDRARHAKQRVFVPFNEYIPEGSILRRVGN